jgi:hypothetical protein
MQQGLEGGGRGRGRDEGGGRGREETLKCLSYNHIPVQHEMKGLQRYFATLVKTPYM